MMPCCKQLSVGSRSIALNLCVSSGIRKNHRRASNSSSAETGEQRDYRGEERERERDGGGMNRAVLLFNSSLSLSLQLCSHRPITEPGCKEEGKATLRLAESSVAFSIHSAFFSPSRFLFVYPFASFSHSSVSYLLPLPHCFISALPASCNSWVSSQSESVFIRKTERKST